MKIYSYVRDEDELVAVEDCSNESLQVKWVKSC